MKKIALGLLFLTAAGVAAPLSAREPAILDILSASRISGYLVWDAVPQEKGRKLKCLVTRGDAGEQLDFYLSTGKDNRLLLSHRLGDRLLAMFPTSESGGDLVVVSSAGSTARAAVFSVEHGRVRKILDEETKAMPEVVRLEGDEKPAIVTFADSGERGRNFRVVHRWNGKRYAAAAGDETAKTPQKPKPPEQPAADSAPEAGKPPEGKNPP